MTTDSCPRQGARGPGVSIGMVAWLLAIVAGCSSGGEGPKWEPEPCQQVPVVETAVNLSYSPPVLPIKLSVSSAGKVSVALSADWVTPLGTFSAGVETSYTFAKKNPTSYLLVIRAVKDGKFEETGYEIDCRRSYRVFLDGKFVQEMNLERTVITVEPGMESTVVVVDAASNVGPDMKPLPEFTEMPSQGFTLPDPLGHHGLAVDLDTHGPNVDEYVIGSPYRTEDADLRYGYGEGLEAGYEAAFGRTDIPNPTAEQCRADARGNAVGTLDQAALRAGQRYCVETSAGNVVLLTLTAVNGPYPERYTVSVDVSTRWQKVR